MGYKSVCVNCRKAFSQGNDFQNFRQSVYSVCGEKMILVNQKFKPPKQNSKKEWKVIGALLKGGYSSLSINLAGQ